MRECNTCMAQVKLVNTMMDVFSIRMIEEPLNKGDIVTIGESGNFRKAKKGEKVMGVVIESTYPEGVLFIWDEKDV